ncbi:unnamed protein product, partial [Ectocarpus sp. 12 AP-2014]
HAENVRVHTAVHANTERPQAAVSGASVTPTAYLDRLKYSSRLQQYYLPPRRCCSLTPPVRSFMSLRKHLCMLQHGQQIKRRSIHYCKRPSAPVLTVRGILS